MRTVVDANILVRAIMRPQGPARLILDRLTLDPNRLILSPYILDEARRVLTYPRIQKHIQNSDQEVDEYVALLSACAEVVEPSRIIPISRDANDDAVIALAVESGAHVVCSFDKDLHDPPVRAYLATYGIEVLTDAELLDRLRQQQAEGT